MVQVGGDDENDDDDGRQTSNNNDTNIFRNGSGSGSSSSEEIWHDCRSSWDSARTETEPLPSSEQTALLSHAPSLSQSATLKPQQAQVSFAEPSSCRSREGPSYGAVAGTNTTTGTASFAAVGRNYNIATDTNNDASENYEDLAHSENDTHDNDLDTHRRPLHRPLLHRNGTDTTHIPPESCYSSGLWFIF